MIKMPFLLLNNLNDINCGHVRKFVMRSIIFWTMFLSDNNQADIIEAFNSTSRYLDELLNIDNPYFEQMLGQIYPTELQLNKANSSDTEAPFFGLELVNNNWHNVGFYQGDSTLFTKKNYNFI